MIINHRKSFTTWAALIGLLVFFSSSWAQSDKIISYLFSIPDGQSGMGGDLYYYLHCDSLPDQVYTKISYADYFRESGLEVNNANYSRQMISGINFTPPTLKYISLHIEGGKNLSEFSDQNLNQDQSIRIKDADEFFNTKITYDLGQKTRFAFSFMGRSDQELGFGFAVFGQLKDYGRYNVSWTRDYFEMYASSNYENNPIFLALSSQRESSNASLNFDLTDQIQLNLAGQNSLWIENNGGEDKPELQPFGKEQNYKISLAYALNKNLFYAGGRGIKYNLSGYGHYHYDIFAKMTVFDLSVYSLFAGYEYKSAKSQTVVEFEASNYEGRISGHIQFWPYTRTIVDLLGSRAYYSSGYEGEIYRFHLGRHQRINSNLNLNCGLNLFDFHTDTFAEIYYLMLFDYDFYKLEIERIQGGLLSFGFDYKISNWQLKYDFAQLIPIKIWREDYGPDHPGPTPETTFESPNAYGGGFHNLSLVFYF